MSETYSEPDDACPDCDGTGIRTENEGDFDEGENRCPCGTVPETEDE